MNNKGSKREMDIFQRVNNKCRNTQDDDLTIYKSKQQKLLHKKDITKAQPYYPNTFEQLISKLSQILRLKNGNKPSLHSCPEPKNHAGFFPKLKVFRWFHA